MEPEQICSAQNFGWSIRQAIGIIPRGRCPLPQMVRRGRWQAHCGTGWLGIADREKGDRPRLSYVLDPQHLRSRWAVDRRAHQRLLIDVNMAASGRPIITGAAQYRRSSKSGPWPWFIPAPQASTASRCCTSSTAAQSHSHPAGEHDDIKTEDLDSEEDHADLPA